jgi:hypothetical protein
MPVFDLTFRMQDFQILNTRSRHEDTDFVTMAVDVNGQTHGPVTVSMGDLNNGTFNPNISIGPIRVGEDLPSVVVHYSIANMGHGDPSAIESKLQQLANQAIQFGGTELQQWLDGQIPQPDPSDPVTVVLAVVAPVVINILITAGEKIANNFVDGLIAAFFADCDGLCVFDNILIRPQDIAGFLATGQHQETRTYPGSNSPSGCGNNSEYQVTWSLTAAPVAPTWQSLGENIVEGPYTISEQDGRVRVWARDTSNQIVYTEQSAPSAGPWSAWQPLTPPGAFNFRPAKHADGRLRLIARPTAEPSLESIAQTAPGGSWQSNWNGFGSISLVGAGAPGIVKGYPAVMVWPDGRLEIFWRGGNDALHHLWENAPNGQWQGPGDLGGILVDYPAVAMDGNGHGMVFSVGTDQGMALTHWDPATGWTWAGLGGVFQPQTPAAITWPDDGHVEVFARGTDNALWHNWQNGRGGPWLGWRSLGGSIQGNVAAITDHNGQGNVFAVGTQGNLLRAAHSFEGWLWENLGGGVVGTPAPALNTDGRLEVFVRGTDNRVYHTWQNTPGGLWSGE